eukprot:1047631-Ditylum_brightwellii.AAC.1
MSGGEDNKGLGRWSYVQIAGKEKKKVMFVTAYNPVYKQTKETAQSQHIINEYSQCKETQMPHHVKRSTKIYWRKLENGGTNAMQSY